MQTRKTERRARPAFFLFPIRIEFFVSAGLIAALLAPFSALASLILLSLAGLSGSYRHLLVSRPSLAWLMAAWLVWLPLSAFWALSTGLALEIASLLLGLPLAWLVGRALHEQGRLKPFLQMIIPIVLAGLLAWGLWQGPNTFTSKPQGPFNDPNTYAAVLDLLLLPILARYLGADLEASSRLWRTTTLGLIGAHGLVFFLVASRGATLALLLVLPILLWQAKDRTHFTRKLALLLAVYLVAYCTAWLVNTSGTSLGGRLGTLATQGDGVRWQLMSSAWWMIQEHPWLGTGLGSFQFLYPRYRDPLESSTGGGWVHNDYLQLWLEGGILALALLLGLLAWTLWRSLREAKSREPEALERMGYLTAVLATLLHTSVNFVIYFSIVAVMLGLYLACLTPSTASRSPTRAWRLATGGYILTLGYLMLGMVAVDGLLGQRHAVQGLALKMGKFYPHIDAAIWLSVASPFHYGPGMVLADELGQFWRDSGKLDPSMLTGALSELENSLLLLPCNPGASSQALHLLSQAPNQPELVVKARTHIDQALSCDPRNGIAYYYAGLILEKRAPELALDYWRAGLVASTHRGERMLLAAILLSREMLEQKTHFEAVAEKLAQVWLALYRQQPTGVTAEFGYETYLNLRAFGGKNFKTLLRNYPATNETPHFWGDWEERAASDNRRGDHSGQSKQDVRTLDADTGGNANPPDGAAGRAYRQGIF